MSPSTSGSIVCYVSVGHDSAQDVYLIRVLGPLDDDFVMVRDHVVEPMIASGEFTKAPYDIGQNGAIAVKLGAIGDELDKASDTCAALERVLNGICQAVDAKA